MRKIYTLLMAISVIGAAVLICGCTSLRGDDRNQTPAPAPAGANLTVVEVLNRDDNFSTFVWALGASKLEGTLAGPGPYTVFAPTDEAFDRLPPGTLDDLLKDPKGNLAEVLLYHMTPGAYTASDIAANKTIATLQGNPLAGGDAAVNGARVIRADIPAENGFVHAIDTVLIPPEVILQEENETATNVTPSGTGGTTNATE